VLDLEPGDGRAGELTPVQPIEPQDRGQSGHPDGGGGTEVERSPELPTGTGGALLEDGTMPTTVGELRSELPPGGGGHLDLAGEPGEVLREIRRATGGADGVIGKARILEVDEVPFSVSVQLPTPSKPESGVDLLPTLDGRLEAELVVRPDPLRSEEHGEILQQLARSAVPGEAVEGV